MTDKSIHVEGVKEAQDAFRGVGRDLSESQAAFAQDAAEVLIPDITRMSRKHTGAMSQGFGVETEETSAFFVNTEEYWTFQEFGTEDVEPTRAIQRSWERNEKDVVEAYDKNVKQTAKENGFEQ